jgi:lysozyme
MARHINQAGLKLLMASEGCRLNCYRDSAGVATIGFGHTGPDVADGMVISRDEADRLLLEDVAKFEKAVDELVKVEIGSNAYSACVVFCFNVGISAFRRSTLLRLLNNRDFEGCSKQFSLWNKIRDRDGKSRPLAGLTLRRRNESLLFMRPDRC